MENKELKFEWKTTFTHTGDGINIMTCDFGHEVKVLVDYPNAVIQKKFGGVTVDEFPIDYFDMLGWNLFLSNIAFEIASKNQVKTIIEEGEV